MAEVESDFKSIRKVFYLIKIRGVTILFFLESELESELNPFWNQFQYRNQFQYSKKIDFCWNWNNLFMKNDENPILIPVPAWTRNTSNRNQMILGEQSRAAERFTWSEFQPIPPKGANLRVLWSPVVTANSLALEHSMAG